MSKSTKPKTDGFKIRFAEEKDLETIFEMIKELAEYEKLLDKLEATRELISKSLFQLKVSETLIGEYQGKPVGYAIFFLNFSSFVGRAGIYIEDIYVKPEQRGKGFGKAFFSFIAQLAVERKYGRLEWACLDWNEPSIAFYKKMGAEPMREWTVYRVAGKEMEKLAQEP
jgi:GNAT superfamily N-acetyltransferase